MRLQYRFLVVCKSREGWLERDQPMKELAAVRVHQFTDGRSSQRGETSVEVSDLTAKMKEQGGDHVVVIAKLFGY